MISFDCDINWRSFSINYNDDWSFFDWLNWWDYLNVGSTVIMGRFDLRSNNPIKINHYGSTTQISRQFKNHRQQKNMQISNTICIIISMFSENCYANVHHFTALRVFYAVFYGISIQKACFQWLYINYRNYWNVAQSGGWKILQTSWLFWQSLMIFNL